MFKAERKGRGGTRRDSASVYIVGQQNRAQNNSGSHTSLATKTSLAEKLVGSVLWGFVQLMVSGFFLVAYCLVMCVIMFPLLCSRCMKK